MGMLEVVMLAVIGCKVVLGMEKECRWIQDLGVYSKKLTDGVLAWLSV